MMSQKANVVALLILLVQNPTASQETRAYADPLSSSLYEGIINKVLSSSNDIDHFSSGNKTEINIHSPSTTLQNTQLNLTNEYDSSSNKLDNIKPSIADNGDLLSFDDYTQSPVIPDDYLEQSTSSIEDEDFPDVSRLSADSYPFNMEGSEIGEATFVVPEDAGGSRAELPPSESPRRTYALTVNDGQVKHRDIRKDNGEYVFSYTSADGSRRQEMGRLVTETNGHKVMEVKGSYDYGTPDGQRFRVEYQADTNGYRILNNSPVISSTPTSNINLVSNNKPTSIRPVSNNTPVTYNKPVISGTPTSNRPISSYRPVSNNTAVSYNKPVISSTPTSNRPISSYRPVSNISPDSNNRPNSNINLVSNNKPVINNKPTNNRPITSYRPVSINKPVISNNVDTWGRPTTVYRPGKLPHGGSQNIVNNSGGNMAYSRPGGGNTAYSRPNGENTAYSRPNGGNTAYSRPSGGGATYSRPSGGRKPLVKPTFNVGGPTPGQARPSGTYNYAVSRPVSQDSRPSTYALPLSNWPFTNRQSKHKSAQMIFPYHVFVSTKEDVVDYPV